MRLVFELDPDEEPLPETFDVLMQAVAESVCDTMRIGQSKKHRPGMWQTESPEHHLYHGVTHGIDVIRYGRDSDLASWLCRAAFAIWTRKNRK